MSPTSRPDTERPAATLAERFAATDPQRIALIGRHGRQGFGDLTTEARALAARLAPAAGLRVFLNLADISDALAALAALDGIAGAVVLSSPALPADVLVEMIATAGADALLTDRSDLSAAGCAIVADITDLAALRPARATAGGTEWIMTTSGTTGRPKLVRHSLDSLTRTARTDHARGAGQVWGLLYDYTRFAGLQVLLQSVLSGATLIAPDPDLPLENRLRQLAENACTHLSATPTLWRKILMTPGGDALALRQVTLGGEIADDVVLRALARAFPQARISHIFASTEAGVGFSVTDGRAGFPESYLSAPPQGIGLRVEDGQLFIRNDKVGASYLGGGDLARDGWVDTGDLVRIEDGRILFLGRGSGVINVGGDKVVPEEIEAVLLAHPGVHMAKVYAKSNPIMGALVAADIQPAEGADTETLRAGVKDWCASRLERHKVPAFVRLVDQFQTNAAGKIERSTP